MQLFVCEFQIKKDQIIIEDQNILYQLRKVLRSKIWDSIFVQKNWNADCRYEINIHNRDDKRLVWNITNTIYNQNFENIFWMIICMPNKRDKAEMIVQKLTEIGINSIVFWPSERSVIRDINLSKMERLEKISKEAVEQSWWWSLPKIEFVGDLKNIIENSKLLIFDKKLNEASQTPDKQWLKCYWLVWPEGGLTDGDYKNFGNNFKIKSLGDNILRTETAAIIGAREIKNLKCWIWN